MITMKFAALLAASTAATPDTDTRRAHYHLEKAGLAIEGYDPVAYFPEGGGKPAKGKKTLEVEHLGVRYRFSSEANKKRFEDSPQKYEPAYGGWCAYAMGTSGDKVDVDPTSYEVHDGRLYLFYKSLFANTLKSWKPKRAELKPKADAAWTKHLSS